MMNVCVRACVCVEPNRSSLQAPTVCSCNSIRMMNKCFWGWMEKVPYRNGRLPSSWVSG